VVRGSDDGTRDHPWASVRIGGGAGSGPRHRPWGRSDDDIMMLYTGGTTGMPKGVMWRQATCGWSWRRRQSHHGYPTGTRSRRARERLEAAAGFAAGQPAAGLSMMHGTLGCFTSLLVFNGAVCVRTLPDRSSTRLALATAQDDRHPPSWDRADLTTIPAVWTRARQPRASKRITSGFFRGMWRSRVSRRA